MYCFGPLCRRKRQLFRSPRAPSIVSCGAFATIQRCHSSQYPCALARHRIVCDCGGRSNVADSMSHCRAVAPALFRWVSPRSIYFLRSVILSAAKDPCAVQISIAAPEAPHPINLAPQVFADRKVRVRMWKTMSKRRWKNRKSRVPHLPPRALCAAKVGRQCLPPLHAFALAVAVVFLRSGKQPRTRRWCPTHLP